MRTSFCFKLIYLLSSQGLKRNKQLIFNSKIKNVIKKFFLDFGPETDDEDDSDSPFEIVPTTDSVFGSDSTFVSDRTTQKIPTISRGTTSRIFRGRMSKKSQIVFNDHHDNFDLVNGYRESTAENYNHSLVQLCSIVLPLCLVLATFALLYFRISYVLEVNFT